MRKTVRILGTQGVPANYGGFETAAENIALFLVAHGWRVIVYCQTTGTGPMQEDTWNGIERVTIPVSLPGWKGTSYFDWIAIAHACKFNELCLTFGYNTALFSTNPEPDSTSVLTPPPPPITSFPAPPVN